MVTFVVIVLHLNIGRFMELPAKHNYYVFIVTNEDKKTLSTGIAANLTERLYQLEQSLFTPLNPESKISTCVYLIYWEGFSDALAAMEREQTIKKLSKKKKIEIINKVNPEWRFLNEDTYRGQNKYHY